MTTKNPKNPFLFEALVDFLDDALITPVPITPQHVDNMMRRLKELGVRRVSWAYYGDGRGGLLMPAEYTGDYDGGWPKCVATYRILGNPLKVAVEAGHRHGLEVYAYFKPYETGLGMMFPEGSPQAKKMGLLPCLGGRYACVDPFVKDHPHLRIKRRSDDLPPNLDQAVVTTVRLIKKDDSPTRVTADHLQIWTSAENWQYKRADVKFKFAETVEKARHDVRDHNGNLLTPVGAPVRVLTLSGLSLTDKFILITTDFTDGPSDFINAGTAMVEVLDSEGRLLPISVANGGTVWCSDLMDFRNAGLAFDWAWDAAPTTLDCSNANGRQGLIAFTVGRNEYLNGSLCETEPEVQAFWLRCLEEMIEAGVDGVDFREENHSMMTDYPEDYGFNDVILRQCGNLKGEALLEKIAKVRGNAYTEFLRTCKRRLAAAGRKMRYNIQIDWFRPDRPRHRACAYPAHMEWQWQRWIAEGLMDEAILRSYSIVYHGEPIETMLNDPVTKEVTAACAAKGIPITFNRYLSATKPEKVPAEVAAVRADGRFSGFIFYETYDFIRFGHAGEATIAPNYSSLANAVAG